MSYDNEDKRDGNDFDGDIAADEAIQTEYGAFAQ